MWRFSASAPYWRWRSNRRTGTRWSWGRATGRQHATLPGQGRKQCPAKNPSPCSGEFDKIVAKYRKYRKYRKESGLLAGYIYMSSVSWNVMTIVKYEDVGGQVSWLKKQTNNCPGSRSRLVKKIQTNVSAPPSPAVMFVRSWVQVIKFYYFRVSR